MDESDFEGSVILERLNEIGAVDEFFEDIDSDNFEKVRKLLRRAHIDTESINMVLEKMAQES